MRHIKKLNEGFDPNFLGYEKPDYRRQVKDAVFRIVMEDIGISEKSFQALDRAELVMEAEFVKREQELNTIVGNCSQRQFRVNYCAEAVYDAVLKGKFRALNERAWDMGGFARTDTDI